MHNNKALDQSNGYEAVSREFMSIRSQSAGVAAVQRWAQSLPRGSSVLELGCGHGIPISKALIDAGLTVYGIDASPTMIAAFRDRFPDNLVECSAVEDSRFFDRSFDGIIAWGLMFLLAPVAQKALLRKIAAALGADGQFFFTAPHQVCEWADNLTGRQSVSLGADAYRKLLENEGLVLVSGAVDERQNHYYSGYKPISADNRV